MAIIMAWAALELQGRVITVAPPWLVPAAEAVALAQWAVLEWLEPAAMEAPDWDTISVAAGSTMPAAAVAGAELRGSAPMAAETADPPEATEKMVWAAVVVPVMQAGGAVRGS